MVRMTLLQLLLISLWFCLANVSLANAKDLVGNGKNLMTKDDVTSAIFERLLLEQDARHNQQLQDFKEQIELLNNRLQEQSSELRALKGIVKEQQRQLTSQRELVHILLQDCKEKPNPSASRAKQLDQHDAFSERSDDSGPWEIVVSQLSQKVTEMSADIQSMKTQNAADIQALQSDIQSMKTQNAADIQALQSDIQSTKTQNGANIQALQISITQQGKTIQDARSSMFVQWGRRQCNSYAQLVYSGFVGGSGYVAPGAATNYLCLSPTPIFGPPQNAYGAYLFGAEYETSDARQDKDPACAVCRSTFSTTVMIPGTNVCSPGWYLQYNGFLMAGAANSAAGTEFICVDSALENSANSKDESLGGTLLYYTATRCGSLPCDPYHQDKTVTCAVCSK